MVVLRAVHELIPSPENDKLYKPIAPDDVADLVESVRLIGVQQPLIVSNDGFVISGHRRLAAAKLAGLREIPCIVDPIRRSDDPDGFVRLLREHNRQRIKTRDELFREELVSVDPERAHAALQEARQPLGQPAASFRVGGRKRRSGISAAKTPMLRAAQAVLDERREFWPLTVRQVHYALLNDPPLRHASKPQSIYANDRQSYQDLCDLLTRARLVWDIPMEAIEDETRPVQTWPVHPNVQLYTRAELHSFLRTYWRDLLQSQPDQIEIVVEKNSVRSIVEPISREFTVPLTSGRGYCSLPPRAAMTERFENSGKEGLVLLLLSDLDPDGDSISESFARSMRDDFDIDDVVPIRVAITPDQVDEYGLTPKMKAKRTSAQYRRFIDRHAGDDVYELEALEPAALQEIVREAVLSVLDVAAYNDELRAERDDAAFLEARRQQVCKLMAGLEEDSK